MSTKRIRVEFRLSMPGVSSWDGHWSGGGRHYSLVRTLPADVAERLCGANGIASWSYGFSDGWRARVEASKVRVGVKLKKSDGFLGYDWMVNSIIETGAIAAPVSMP
jgi:hypothetical protein